MTTWNMIPQLDIQSKRRAVVLLKISAAVRRSFGSCRSIFLTKSFAPLDIEGQGSEEKSMWPRKTASNMPSSFSGESKRWSEGNNQLRKSDRREKKTEMICLKNITCPKRRNTRQKDVKNNPSTPYVSLCPIVPFQYLRSNIIRTSHKILKRLPCIIHYGFSFSLLMSICK